MCAATKAAFQKRAPHFRHGLRPNWSTLSGDGKCPNVTDSSRAWYTSANINYVHPNRSNGASLPGSPIAVMLHLIFVIEPPTWELSGDREVASIRVVHQSVPSSKG